MLCSLAFYSQYWEVVVYQEMIYIFALGQKYGTCNYVRKRQSLPTGKTDTIKVSVRMCVDETVVWVSACLTFHRA